jgi:hypothetical protein
MGGEDVPQPPEWEALGNVIHSSTDPGKRHGQLCPQRPATVTAFKPLRSRATDAVTLPADLLLVSSTTAMLIIRKAGT